jgi:hypothetical protein
MPKRRLTIRRGGEVVAVLTGERLEVTDIGTLDGSMVYQLVSLGVPVSREDPGVRYEFWRVQAGDGDFAAALAEYIGQYGLEVEAG